MNKNPIAFAESYWANCQLSIVRQFGAIKFNGTEYVIVNKDGIDIFACSIIAQKEGRDKAIPPGEPCDLVQRKYVPEYHKLGRVAFYDKYKTQIYV